MHRILGVPAVAATTIVGTTIFATLSKQPNVVWQIHRNAINCSFRPVADRDLQHTSGGGGTPL
jgi:hypothetical protein